MLNGVYVYEHIKEELREGEAVLVKNYKPRFQSSENDSKADPFEIP